MTINERLRMLRERSGLTLDDVSKHVGVTKQTVQKYESGVVVSIPSDKIELLAKVYNVSPGYIMGWETLDKTPAAPNGNGDNMAYRERLRRDRGARMLLDATKDATDEEMRQYVNLIKALRYKPNEDE